MDVTFDGTTIGTVGGQAPVQGDGEVDGYPWYFRARGTHWALSVAEVAGDPVQAGWGSQPGWHVACEYGTGPFDASWMPHEEAVEFIGQALAAWRQGHLTRRNARRN